MMYKNSSFSLARFNYFHPRMSKPFRSIKVIPLNKVSPLVINQRKYAIVTPLTHCPCMDVADFTSAVSVKITFIHQFWSSCITTIKFNLRNAFVV